MEALNIRCSSLYRITSESKDSRGLTDKQAQYLEDLIKKEESPKLTQKQQAKVEELIQKKNDSKITENQIKELNRLLDKKNGPRLTPKQQNDKFELIAKRDYKPEFDLSQGAKTYIASLMKERIYGYKRKVVSNLATEKGQYCEQDAIKLYRKVNFRLEKDCQKNKTRLTKNFLSGEVDIYQESLKIITDTKVAETWESFPSLSFEIEKRAKEGGYIDQGHGYMKLWNEHGFEAERYEIAYCMIETPQHLIPEWEDERSRHKVDPDLPLSLRITTFEFERDIEREKYIHYKCQEAQKYAKWYFDAITNKY